MALARLARLVTAAVITSCALAPVAAADSNPQLSFDPKPTYLQPREVVLTFNDAPGWSRAAHDVLDVLRERGVKATFFINTGPETTDWSATGHARSVVTRIIEEGHVVASHTRNHRKLPELRTRAALRGEVSGVQDDLTTHLGYAQRISLFRAPFGSPYLRNYQRTELGWDWPDEGYARVAPVVAQRVVHIGWNIDSEDWKCPRDWSGGECVFATTRARLEQGHHGIILMHVSGEATALGLVRLLDYLDANGYRVASVEEAVCNALGATSANVIDGVDRCDLP